MGAAGWEPLARRRGPSSSRMFHVKHLFWSSVWRILSVSGSLACGKIRLLAIGPPVSRKRKTPTWGFAARDRDGGVLRRRNEEEDCQKSDFSAHGEVGTRRRRRFRPMHRPETGGVERDLAHNPLAGPPAPIPRGFHPDGAVSRLRGRGGATRRRATWGNARNREGMGPDPQQVGENCAREARPAAPRRRAFAGPPAGLCPNLT